MSTVLVAGIGNLFLSDDGFGPEVVRRLARRPRPDAGAGGRLRHPRHAPGLRPARPRRPLVIVDAVPGPGEPGTIRVLEVGPGGPRRWGVRRARHEPGGGAGQPRGAGRDPAADVRRRLRPRERRRGDRAQRRRWRRPSTAASPRCAALLAELSGGGLTCASASPVGWWSWSTATPTRSPWSTWREPSAGSTSACSTRRRDPGTGCSSTWASPSRWSPRQDAARALAGLEMIGQRHAPGGCAGGSRSPASCRASASARSSTPPRASSG